MFELKIKFDIDEGSLREAMHAELRSGIEATAAGILCPEHHKSATISWPGGASPSSNNLRFEAEVCCPKLEALLAEGLGGAPDHTGSEDDGEPPTGS